MCNLKEVVTRSSSCGCDGSTVPLQADGFGVALSVLRRRCIAGACRLSPRELSHLLSLESCPGWKARGAVWRVCAPRWVATTYVAVTPVSEWRMRVSVCPAGGVFRESMTRNTEMASTGTDMITGINIEVASVRVRVGRQTSRPPIGPLHTGFAPDRSPLIHSLTCGPWASASTGRCAPRTC